MTAVVDPPTTGTGPTTRTHIRPLTGIRAVAAFWVFLRHFRAELLDAFPFLGSLTPLMNVGYLGVDLFFILSGFILTVTHLDRMNQNPGWRTSLRFLWLRIGRVWPLTAFVLLLFGSYFTVQLIATGDQRWADALDIPRLIHHLLLIQAWYPHELDWNGLDWSISAEWMAYLTFGLGGVLLLGRIEGHIHPRIILVAIAALTVPMIVVGWSMQDDTILLFSPDTWTVNSGVVATRVLTEFWAGALLAVVLRRRMLQPASRAPIPTITVVAIIGVILLVSALDPNRWTRPNQLEQHHTGVDLIASTETIVVLPLFVVLIGSLAVCGRDPLARLLGTRPLVLGGRASYALYLSHPLVIGAGVVTIDRLGATGPLLALLTVGVVIASWAFAVMLWYFIEEPARHAARRMLQRTPAP